MNTDDLKQAFFDAYQKHNIEPDLKIEEYTYSSTLQVSFVVRRYTSAFKISQHYDVVVENVTLLPKERLFVILTLTPKL